MLKALNQENNIVKLLIKITYHLYDLIDVPRNIDIMKARMIEYQPELNIKMYENYQYELAKSIKLYVKGDLKSFHQKMMICKKKCLVSSEKVSDVKKLFKFMKPTNAHALDKHFVEYASNSK